MKYKVTKGLKDVINIFNELKKDLIVTHSYFAKTILSLYKGESGITYEPKRKKITIVCEENNDLLKKFNELINKKQIKLEEIK